MDHGEVPFSTDEQKNHIALIIKSHMGKPAGFIDLYIYIYIYIKASVVVVKLSLTRE